jgi:cAMP-dependent protein kinase regulator
MGGEKEESEKDSEEDSDDFGEPTEAELKAEAEKRAKMAGRMRRDSVSAAVMRVNDSYKPPSHEKSKEEREALVEMINKNKDCGVLFGHLDKANFNQVIDAFKKMEVPAGENLIKQGDEGDYFYVVISGKVDIFVARKGDKPPGNKVLSVSSGAIFGQLALMYNAPRAATCSVVEDASVWALERETFQQTLINQQSVTKKGYEGFLEGLDFFQHLNHYERSRVADLLHPLTLKKDEAVIKQGDEGDAFYIIEKGQCAASIDGEKGEVVVKTYDKPGQYFGERALLKGEPRAATVRAVEDGSIVLQLKKEDFDATMGPLMDQMKANLDKYPQYKSIMA